jgi:DNA-binding transcriptional regulator YiaG
VNWLIMPFSMALLAWIFIAHLFRPWLPSDQITGYTAGLILLAAAPCTAMVFVWSNLVDGEPHFTLRCPHSLELLRETEPITAAAESDPDNPPLMDEELERVEAVRARTGLSQGRFAEAYRINVARLRDLEQGRTKPDRAMLAYLMVIEREPEGVERALREGVRARAQYSPPGLLYSIRCNISFCTSDVPS